MATAISDTESENEMFQAALREVEKSRKNSTKEEAHRK
jgi:hypothetical protein